MNKPKDMKKLFCVLCIFAILHACNTNDDEYVDLKFELISTDYTDCLGKSALKNETNEKVIISHIDQNNFKIEHQNVEFNCCLPEGIDVIVYKSNDTIYYTDREKVARNCKCICNYNTLADFGGIIKGEYIFCLITGDKLKGSIKLMFDENMFEEVTISELIVN